MLTFYFNGSPNPSKVALFLEEAGLAYTPVPVDTRKGEQFAPEIVKLNPNAKIPILVDDGAVIFDSNAILLHLADKTGQFGVPVGHVQRGEMLSWLMFVASGIGPFGGQAVHFKHFAPEPVPYANTRYQYEALRHWQVVDQRLATRRYMLGDAYTIVDMALWGWTRMTPFIMGDDAWAKVPNVKRHHDEINARPAAQRALALKDKFTFKTVLDDDARRHMFKHVQA
jgi:GST-like protein